LNNKEEMKIGQKYTNCSLNDLQGRKKQSSNKELLTSETIQSIENTWLRRQRCKKKRKTFGYSLEHQIIKEGRNNMSVKKNIEHIYNEMGLENINHFNNQYSERVNSNSTQLALPIEGSFTESTAINFQDETIPVACSCFSYQSWNNLAKHFRFIFSNNLFKNSMKSGNKNLKDIFNA
jgi:AraC-like DNA-binding protein